MTARTILTIINLTLLFFYCADGVRVPQSTLIPEKSIVMLDDSTFFSRSISAMKIKDNLLYFTDTMNGRVVVVDSIFHVLKVIGTKGKGPGELFNAWFFAFWKDSIYISDSENKINVFTISGKYIRRFFLEDNPRIETCFDISGNGEIFINTPLANHPISVYSIKGKFNRGFGEWISIQNEYEKYTRNQLSIHIEDSVIICINTSEPTVQIYNVKGNMLARNDLSNIEILKDRLKTIRETQAKLRKNHPTTFFTFPILFANSFFKNNQLFLLFEKNYKTYAISNSVLKLQLKGNNFSPIKSYYLNNNEEEEGNFQNICLFNNSFFSYETLTGKIYKFNSH